MLLADLAREMDSLAPRLTKKELVCGKAWEYHNAMTGNYVLLMQGFGEESKPVITIVAGRQVAGRVAGLVAGLVAGQYTARPGRDFLTIHLEHLSDRAARDVLVAIAGAVQAPF